MAAFEQVLKNAVTDFTAGDLKNGYENYLKAAFTLILQLSEEVVFEDKNKVTSLPNHVYNLFTLSHKCLQTAEDIIRNWSVHAPDTFPFTSLEADVIQPEKKSVITVETTLPLIPLSPLTQMSIIHSSSLASSSHKLALIKHSKSPTASEVLNRIVEDVSIHRSNLDTVNAQIQSVSDVLITTWSPEVVAKQLTIIEAQLFAKIIIPDDLLSSESTSARVQGCLDFHRYIECSFAHQIIAGSEVSVHFSEVNRDEIIVHMIRVAYLLLHVYRNFNSFAAVVKALTNPEVQRLTKSWKLVPRKMKQILNDLMVHISSEENYHPYRALFESVLKEYDSSDSAMIGIPWMERHTETIRNIIQIYSTEQRSEYGPTISPEGASRLEYMLEILTQLQTNQPKNPQVSPWQPALGRKILVQVNDTTLQVDPPSDLQGISGSDLGLHHWLLSRVFINRYQLWEESVEYQGLCKNETIPTFLKDNKVVEVEIDDRMRDQEELREIIDLKSFDQFFPKKGEIPVMDLEQMESVDEFLTFLDQEMVGQTQQDIGGKEKVELFVPHLLEFDPSSPISPLPSSLKIQDMSRIPQQEEEEEMNEKVQDVLDNISIPSIDENENHQVDVEPIGLSPDFPTTIRNTVRNPSSSYLEEFEETYDERDIYNHSVLPEETMACVSTITPVSNATEPSFSLKLMDHVENPWDSFLGDFDSENFLTQHLEDSSASNQLLQDSRILTSHGDIRFDHFQTDVGNHIHSTPKPLLDTKSIDSTVLLDSSWMHSELPIPSYLPYSFNHSQTSSMVQEVDEQELTEVFHDMLKYDQEILNSKNPSPMIDEEKESVEEERFPFDHTKEISISSKTQEFDQVKEKEISREDQLGVELRDDLAESAINFAADEELMSDYHPEDFEAISEGDESHPVVKETVLENQDSFIDPVKFNDEIDDIHQGIVEYECLVQHDTEDHPFGDLLETSSLIIETSTNTEIESFGVDHLAETTSLKSISDDSFPEESPEAIVAQLMMGVDVFRGDFPSVHDTILNKQDDQGRLVDMEDTDVAAAIDMTNVKTEVDSLSSTSNVANDHQLYGIVSGSIESLSPNEESINPFNDLYAVQDELIESSDTVKTTFPSKTDQGNLDHSEINIDNINEVSEINFSEDRVLGSEKSSTGEQSMEASYVSISGYRGMTLADELGLSPILMESVQMPDAEFLCDILDSTGNLADSELVFTTSLEDQILEGSSTSIVSVTGTKEFQIAQVADLLGLEGADASLNVDSFLNSLLDMKLEEPKVFEAFGEHEPMPERLEHKKEVLSKKVERPPKGELLSEILRNDFGVMKNHPDFQSNDPRFMQVTQDFLSLLGSTPPLERLIELNNLLYRNISREESDLPSTSKSWPPHHMTNVQEDHLEASSTMGQVHSEPEMDDHSDISFESNRENESFENKDRAAWGEDRINTSEAPNDVNNTASKEFVDTYEDVMGHNMLNVDDPIKISPFDDSYMIAAEINSEEQRSSEVDQHAQGEVLLFNSDGALDINEPSIPSLNAIILENLLEHKHIGESIKPCSLENRVVFDATSIGISETTGNTRIAVNTKNIMEENGTIATRDLPKVQADSKSYMYLISDSEDEATDAEPLINECTEERQHLIHSGYASSCGDLEVVEETKLVNEKPNSLVRDENSLQQEPDSNIYSEICENESTTSEDDMLVTSISLDDLIRLNHATYEENSDFEIFYPECVENKTEVELLEVDDLSHSNGSHFTQGVSSTIHSLNDLIRLQEPNFESLTISEKADRVLKSMESIENLSSRGSMRKPREPSKTSLSGKLHLVNQDLNQSVESNHTNELISPHPTSKYSPLEGCEGSYVVQESQLDIYKHGDITSEWIDQISNEDFDSELDDIPVEFVSLVDLIKFNKSESLDDVVPLATTDTESDIDENCIEVTEEFLSLDMLERLNEQNSDEEASSESELSSKRSDDQELAAISTSYIEDEDTETDLEDILTKSITLEQLLQLNLNPYLSEEDVKYSSNPLTYSTYDSKNEDGYTSYTDNEPVEFLSLQTLQDLNEFSSDSDLLTITTPNDMNSLKAEECQRKGDTEVLTGGTSTLVDPVKPISLQELIVMNVVDESAFSTDDDLPRVHKRTRRNKRKPKSR